MQSVIELLKETAERFRELRNESDICLTSGDADGYEEKLRDRAKLIVGLPDRLRGRLSGMDQGTKQRILEYVASFARQARQALELEDGDFSLGVLLVPKGTRIGEKNDLERLIASLE